MFKKTLKKKSDGKRDGDKPLIFYWLVVRQCDTIGNSEVYSIAYGHLI